MDIKQRNILRRFKDNILRRFDDNINKSIDLKVLFPYLKESKIFTKTMLDDIKSESDLYDELQTRGPKAFDKFIDVLKQAGFIGQAEELSSQLGKKFSSRMPLPDEYDYKGEKGNFTQNHTESILGDRVMAEHGTRNENKCGPYFPTEDIYKMISSPRGYCLIVNNVDFNGLRDYRWGSDSDANALKDVFTLLDYDVDLQQNLDERSMRDVFKKFSRKKEHSEVDSCIVVVLTHGGAPDTIYGTDLGKIKVGDILEMFDNTNCEILKGKPKMFFLQACRGNKHDSGVPIESTDSISASSNESADSCKIPSCTDMLIAFPTLVNHVAMRNHKHGSWFVTELVTVLKKYSANTDLISMLQRVDRCVKKRMSLGGDKQVTEQRLLGLDKKVYFNPGFKISV